MSRGSRALAATGFALLGVLAFTPTAHADPDPVQVNTGTGWVHDSLTPLFDVSRVFPGWTSTRTLALRNNTADAARLAVSATDIVDRENGCNHPEALVDPTCGANQGELGHEMNIDVYVDAEGDGSFPSSPTWSGNLYDLADPVLVDGAVPAQGVVGLRLTAELPLSSGNETQTDQLGFGFRMSLEGDGSSATVAVQGAKHVRGAGGILQRLPLTGVNVDRWIKGGLWGTLGGIWLLVVIGTARRSVAGQF